MERAEELSRQMTLRSIEPTGTTFEQLIQGHCRVGGIDSGFLLYRDARRRGFGLEVAIVDELLAEMRDGKGCRRAPSRRSYEVLIRGSCEEGEVEEALKLQAEMAGEGFGSSFEVYNAFIEGYRKRGDTDCNGMQLQQCSRCHRCWLMFVSCFILIWISSSDHPVNFGIPNGCCSTQEELICNYM